jgi:hypothetical protein
MLERSTLDIDRDRPLSHPSAGTMHDILVCPPPPAKWSFPKRDISALTYILHFQQIPDLVSGQRSLLYASLECIRVEEPQYAREENL